MAYCNGVCFIVLEPSVANVGFAPWPTNNLTTSIFRDCTAEWSGVFPSRLRSTFGRKELTLAFHCKSMRTVDKCPNSQAWCKGVYPDLLKQSTWAPLCNNNSIDSSSPLRAKLWRGLWPYLDWIFGSPAAFRINLTNSFRLRFLTRQLEA